MSPPSSGPHASTSPVIPSLPSPASASPSSLIPPTRVAPMSTPMPGRSVTDTDKLRQQERLDGSQSLNSHSGASALPPVISIPSRSTLATSDSTVDGSEDAHQKRDRQGPLPQTRTIPSTFITLADSEGLDSDDDEDETPQNDLGGRPLRRRTMTAGPAQTSGPYLSVGVVGQRSLSTPNLHADNSLIISPANSPPSSPSLPAIASVSGMVNRPSSPSAMSLDSDSLRRSESPILTLSPIASPNSSPHMIPQLLVAPVPGMALSGTRAASDNRQGGRTDTISTSSKAKANLPPESSNTNKSSKTKAVSRNSVLSLFDTSGSSKTLPSNFAQKGSLPQDAANTGNSSGLAGLFDAQPQDLTSTPFSLTLAEFRLNDIYPRRQRRLLTLLHRMDHRLRREGVVKKLTKEQLKGKPDKEILKPDRKSLTKDYAKKGGQGGFMAQRIPGFLRSKKLKKRTRPVILHNIEMSIRDKKPDLALQYISLLPSNALKKKKKKSYSGLNHCMLLAMIYRMEQVAIELVDRGFPVDVNYPILGRAGDEYRTKPGRTGPFEYPSYFIVAVGLGMFNLVRAMIKSANLNQSWYGLTPLLLATTLNEFTNATCPPPTLPPAKLASMLSQGKQLHLDIPSQTLINQLPSTFNMSTNAQFRVPGYTSTSPNSIVTMLLEHGADPNHSITLQQYLWANKLKGMGVLSRRRKVLDPREAAGENPLEFYISARRYESGRQWLSHEEIKAQKAARTEAARSGNGKKRFSPEMQEFWKGKSISPVELAIAAGNLDCARTILQRLGPNSLSSSSFGMLLQNDVMLTLSLVKSGSPVSQHDLHGCTPLHLAARRGHLEMVMVLVQLGANVNSRGERQWTPLHESISQNHSNVSSLLVASGADLLAKNDAGETPEDVGRRRGLSPEVLAQHLDASEAKSYNAGFTQPFSGHLQGHVPALSAGTRSGASSRRGSNEQLTASTLKAMMMSSLDRNASLDQSRLSQHYPPSLVDMGNGGNGSKSPLTASQDSLHLLGGGGSGASTPLTPSSSTSSLNGSRSSTTEKKKRVRGFLKKIFN